MAFKNLGNYFEKKKKSVDKYQDRSEHVRQSIRTFLIEKFGDNIKGLSLGVEYNSKENSLTLTANNKTIANELSLYLIEMTDFFKKEKIYLDKILIK